MADTSTVSAATTRQPAASSSPAGTTGTDAEKLAFIEEVTTDVVAVQERVLADILARNADAEYLATRCGLGGATDRVTFRAKVPMVKYEDLELYILRIAHGDRSPILSGSGHPVSEFLTSSGTSGGERKLIPTVKDEVDRRQLLYNLVMPVVKQYVPGLDKATTGLYFYFVKSETTTPGGLPARTALTSYYKSEHFSKSYQYMTSPMAAILCEDAFQSMYAQMVCGLCHRHAMLRVGAVFATGILRAIRFFQRNWEQLAVDMDTGTLTGRVTDASVRVAVAGVLRLDPELAQFIRCDLRGLQGRRRGRRNHRTHLAQRQVPPRRSHGFHGAVRASPQFLPRRLIADHLHHVRVLRGLLRPQPSADVRPVRGVLHRHAQHGLLRVPPHGRRRGRRHGGEPAAARGARPRGGRARVRAGGDHLWRAVPVPRRRRPPRDGVPQRGAGVPVRAPRERAAVRRRGQDGRGGAAARGVDRAASALLRPRGAAVADYTSRACVETAPGHYVIYWELQGCTSSTTNDVLDRCCLEMEEALGSVYMEIRVVRPGTFEELADYAVSRGAAIGQYKVPRCVTAPAVIELLDSRVVSSHLSPALPHWAPGRRF